MTQILPIEQGRLYIVKIQGLASGDYYLFKEQCSLDITFVRDLATPMSYKIARDCGEYWVKRILTIHGYERTYTIEPILQPNPPT